MQALLADGGVLVDGRAVGKSRKLHAGEIVEVLAEPTPTRRPTRAGRGIAVRYEDDDVVVVAKPAGTRRAPGCRPSSGTLVHGLLARYPEIAAVGDPFRPGIVHRLDRDTSGLMVVARAPAAYDTLVEQLSDARGRPAYAGAACGRPTATRGTSTHRSGVPRPAAPEWRCATRPARADRLRGAHRIRSAAVQPARLHARDRSHASDPRASQRDRPSDRR